MDAITEFEAALAAAGYRPKNKALEPDDKWHRLYFLDEHGPADSGRYRLKIMSDGFGFGNFGSDKDPAGIRPWHSRKREKMNPSERAALNARIKAEKEQAEAQRAIEHERAGALAEAYWQKLSPAASTPYTELKGIVPATARQDGTSLVVPVFAGGKFANVQTIQADGTKLFRKGCRIDGGYCALANRDEDRSVIIMVEGYGTGCSVRQATGRPVIVAFTAGNLVAVAAEMRKKYPDSRIIIAADNDDWTFTPGGYEEAGRPDKHEIRGDDPRWEEWRRAGYLTNTGRDKAGRAAASIGGAYVVWPVFDDVSDKPTDFNDYARRHGLEAVRDRILATVPAPAEPTPEEAPDGFRGTSSRDLQPVGGDPFQDDHTRFEPAGHVPDWQELAIYRHTRSGEILDPDKSVNYGVMVEHLLADIFAFDEFKLAVIVAKCPPWKDRNVFRVHELEDVDVTEADYWLQRKGLNGSENKTRGAIFRAALLNPIHPARDYFDALEWDGVKRLDNWLIRICGAETDDPEYLCAVGSKWMIAAVKRVYEPGCQFDHMLILEGGQGAYKSSTLRELATFGDAGLEEEYFTDGFQIKNHKDKDELLKLWGCLIVEIGEMAGFGDTDIETVKNFITIRQDKLRIPFSRLPKTFPRQFVFAGTRNPVGGIFTDPTGNRRFWPVEVGKIDITSLRKEKRQLWAEAAHRYKRGEELKLTDALYLKCAEAAQARRIVDEWTHDVLEKVGSRDFITVREILKDMGLATQNVTRKESKRVQDILVANGFTYCRKWSGGRQVWGWRHDAVKDHLGLRHGAEMIEEEIAF